jgi:uncharacterized protein (DUF2252 family)
MTAAPGISTATSARPKANGSLSTRAELGRTARAAVPRGVHGDWIGPSQRADPIAILEEQARNRVQELVPIRYGRMLSSPFAFYRGAAAVMAADLAGSPDSGLGVQACGDAHASNFGIFATPERGLVFDVNDFDETLPGPWEWDLKRLVASLAIAARYRGVDDKLRAEIVSGAARSYRAAMREFAGMAHLSIWYSRLDTETVQRWRSEASRKQITRTQALAAKAKAKDNLRAVAKLTERRDGRLRFVSAAPLLVPVRELIDDGDVGNGGSGNGDSGNGDSVVSALDEVLERYSQSLRPELRSLLNAYHVVDMARKVVGVGSVGTRAWIVLLEGRDDGDALILQAKEAQASVLEAHVGPSEFAHHGERVVVGQRLMQSSSDIFLGWVTATGIDGQDRHFYVRQLWDWKGSVDLDTILPYSLRVYGELCSWTLARAHARSGDAVAIAAYLGSGDQMDRALVRFAEGYADQNEWDHAALARVAREGRVTAQTGV